MRNSTFIFLTIFYTTIVFTAKSQNKIDTLQQKPTYSIEEIVVTGTRNETDIRHLPLTVSVINRKQIEQKHTPSLLPVLTEQIPGFFNTSRGIMGYGVSGGAAGSMNLRGISSSSGGLMVLIDGHPQYMGIMGHPIADAYQSLMADRVEVLRGPASVLYGSNAMGGVVNIVTRKMEEEGIKTNINTGYGSYNTLQTEVTNRIHKGKFSSIVSGSYNRTDGHRDNMNFEQYGGYAKLGYEISKAWNINIDANITHFNASNPGEIYNPLLDANQRITRGMTSLILENHYKKSSGAFSFFYNFGKHWINDGYTENPDDDNIPKDYRFNSRDKMMGISWYQSAQFFKGNRLTAGIDYYHFGGRAWNQTLNGDKIPQVDKKQNEIAGYIDFRQNIDSWVTLDVGIRFDHHNQAGSEWIPQAGLSFHLPKNINLKLTTSKGFRYPTIRELYMWAAANPNLKPEQIWNYELSFSQHIWDNRLTYNINIFYIVGKNMIMTTFVNGSPLNVNTGKINNAGIEVQTAYRISNSWSINANYSYLHMKKPVLAAPEHKFYIGGLFSIKRWSISSGLQYIAGLYKSLNPVETENFVLWNMQGSFRAAQWLDIWVRGENLLAQRYEINAGFPMPKATVMTGLNINF